jgi:hypothetical protein
MAHIRPFVDCQRDDRHLIAEPEALLTARTEVRGALSCTRELDDADDFRPEQWVGAAIENPGRP